MLREVEEELVRLEAGGDGEALHDFRVALRRLRSVARALETHLGKSFRKGHRRRLRDVARATAIARDAEVQAAWVSEERVRASARDLPGIDWLASWLEASKRDAYGRDLGDPAARFRRVARRLEKALAAGDGPTRGAPVRTLGSALQDLLRSHAAALASTIDGVSGPFDVARAHAVRIAGKRLRYLLEPLRGNRRADSRPAVAVLKELQDLLGELHDAHVAGDKLAEALAEAAAERVREAHAAVRTGEGGAGVLRLARRDPRTRGLLFLDRRAAERAVAAHGRLVREWIPGRRDVLLEEVARIAGALCAPPRPAPPARRASAGRRAPAARMRVPGDTARGRRGGRRGR
jgi:CHAD domain-containing protein